MTLQSSSTRPLWCGQLARASICAREFVIYDNEGFVLRRRTIVKRGPRARKASMLMVSGKAEIKEELRLCLAHGDYQVLEAGTGEEGLAAEAESQPDMVLLDLALPDMDGMAVVKRLRRQSSVPILVVSESKRESEMISALDKGANDYVFKPFSTGELLARMRVLLRSAHLERTQLVRCGRLSVDFSSRTVKVAKRRIYLTPIEYSLLHLLAKHAGKVVTYDQILHSVWGQDQMSKRPYIYVLLSHLREKLEHTSHPPLIITEPCVGIRLSS